jgi:glycerol uptake facilitator protein
MHPLVAEFLGTALLILLGNGVVANVVLSKTKGGQSGWIVITWGWAIGVFVGVFCAQPYSGAHLNPAVTVALAVAGKFAAASVPGYVLAQMGGAFLGGTLVWLFYREHFAITADADGKLACFCTAPNIRVISSAFFCEVVGTIMLVLPVLLMTGASMKLPTAAGDMQTAPIGLGSLGALPVALLVLGIGLSLGGTTGYAINPARDLGPRLAHALWPIPGKRDSDWGYAWVPVVGPLVGGVLAALIVTALV